MCVNERQSRSMFMGRWTSRWSGMEVPTKWNDTTCHQISFALFFPQKPTNQAKQEMQKLKFKYEWASAAAFIGACLTPKEIWFLPRQMPVVVPCPGLSLSSLQSKVGSPFLSLFISSDGIIHGPPGSFHKRQITAGSVFPTPTDLEPQACFYLSFKNCPET